VAAAAEKLSFLVIPSRFERLTENFYHVLSAISKLTSEDLLASIKPVTVLYSLKCYSGECASVQVSSANHSQYSLLPSHLDLGKKISGFRYKRVCHMHGLWGERLASARNP
jgi:hypothetical protein